MLLPHPCLAPHHPLPGTPSSHVWNPIPCLVSHPHHPAAIPSGPCCPHLGPNCPLAPDLAPDFPIWNSCPLPPSSYPATPSNCHLVLLLPAIPSLPCQLASCPTTPCHLALLPPSPPPHLTLLPPPPPIKYHHQMSPPPKKEIWVSEFSDVHFNLTLPGFNLTLHANIIFFTLHGKILQNSCEATPFLPIRYLYESPIKCLQKQMYCWNWGALVFSRFCTGMFLLIDSSRFKIVNKFISQGADSRCSWVSIHALDPDLKELFDF